jgi:MFS family permease
MSNPARVPISPAAITAWATFALIAPLAAIYSVSQFLRNAIGVIAPELSRELDMPATGMGLLSSVFFLSFAAAQIPVGIALDRLGPKRTMLACVVLAVIGVVAFALAPTPTGLLVARMVMGVGCASFFMAPLAIIARERPAGDFARLTSIIFAVGSIGTLIATAPLAFLSLQIGWRSTFMGVAALTAIIGLIVARAVSADAPVFQSASVPTAQQGESLMSALVGVRAATKVPFFWPVFFIHATSYPAFATVIGLWAGPWLSDVAGASATQRGGWLFAGAMAQIVALLIWGRLNRFFGTMTRAIRIGAIASVVCLLSSLVLPPSLVASGAWLVLFGVLIAYTPLVTTHGRALFPPELLGRGLTLMNLGTMGGSFLSQSVTGALMDISGRGADGTYPAQAYGLVYCFLATALACALLFYRSVPDPR